jgi:preprotein translocase subunit SecD
MLKYARWKYILLLVLVLGALLYALPNFFGQAPVLQISSGEGGSLPANVTAQVNGLLSSHSLSAVSSQQQGDLLIVRFDSVVDQSVAKSVLQNGLGDNYTVAQNLVGVSPAWLQALGAEPMRLGLDLRGGMHFLMQVDVDSVIAKREKSDVRSVADALRTNNLRYTNLSQNPDHSLFIQFKDAATRNAAQVALQKSFTDYTLTSLSQGGSEYLQMTLSPAALSALRDYTMSQTTTVLRNRIDALGVAEPIISREGLDRVVVELPGIQDMALAKQMLGGTATLEFHMVDSQHDPASGNVPMGSRLYSMQDGTPILLLNPVVLSGGAITFASAGFDQNGQPAVNLRISGSQVASFSQITAQNIGQRMAIVYVETKNTPQTVNGKVVNTTKKIEKVISAPVVQSALGANFQITGLASTNEAKNLSIQLKSGALPANIYPIQEQTVGPSLGANNIHRGIISVIAGFIFIVGFMAFYYRFMGIIADIALFLNVVFIVAVMSIIGVTMTLPGIAGIVLTMGIAVDANVLIFERIREELRLGMSVHNAIETGYSKAFATIIDANVTTLIVAMTLFTIGSGAVQGFAVTLIIGLLMSMLTAIMGTRALVTLVYGKKAVKKISIGL